jgi:hypothetical protein
VEKGTGMMNKFRKALKKRYITGNIFSMAMTKGKSIK